MTDFQSAKGSGAKFPSIPSERIPCFDFLSLGKGIDYPGSVEDVIPVRAKDENGKTVTISLGEGSILRAIEWALDAESGHVWNSIIGMDTVTDGSGVSSTNSIYTLLFQDNRVENGATCALLFPSTIPGTSNETNVFRFVRGVIKQLLTIDESQPPKTRKGYILVAARISKGSYKTGLADMFFDTSDPATAKAVGKAKASGLTLLRTLGVVDVTDEFIKEIGDPLPDYNVDSLDLTGLADLVSAMKDLAPYRDRS
jgi:hypothetical protein